MSNYHRVYINGGTYFFTLVTHDRKPLLCNNKAIRRLRSAFQYVIKKYPFCIKGIVILPDHLHCIWSLPQDDADFSKRWNLIKRYFSIGINGYINNRREKNIWQKRFWERLIRDEKDLQRCLDYIYYNPVKHGYVNKPSDWLYSTFRRDVGKGLYEIDWGSSCEPDQIQSLNLE